MRRCSNCGRFVAAATIVHIDWGVAFPGMGAGDYHPYHADPTIPCGPVRDAGRRP